MFTNHIDWRFLAEKNNLEKSASCKHRVPMYEEDDDPFVCIDVEVSRREYERQTGLRFGTKLGLVIQSPWLKCCAAPKHEWTLDYKGGTYDGKVYTFALTAEDYSDKAEQKEANDFIAFMENVFDPYFTEEVKRCHAYWNKRNGKTEEIQVLPCVRLENGVKTLFLAIYGVDSPLKYRCGFYEFFSSTLLSMEDSGIDKECDKFIKVALQMQRIRCQNQLCRLEPCLLAANIDFKRSYSKRLVCRRLLSFAIILAPLLLPVYIVLELFDWLEFVSSPSATETITKEWVDSNCRKEKVAVIQNVISFYRATR